MRIRYALAAIAILSLIPVSAYAQKTPSKGTFANAPATTTTTKLANGNVLEYSPYSQLLMSDGPLGNAEDRCVDAWVKTKDGASVSRAGSCFSMSESGDGYSLWWRQTEMATPKCPVACGVFGVYAGFGKFKGLTGDGTWQVKTVFPGGAGWGTFEVNTTTTPGN